MLPLSPNLKEFLHRAHGAWKKKFELLTTSREDVLDFVGDDPDDAGDTAVRGLEDGTQSPASSLDFDLDDGSVRLASTATNDISYAVGTDNFTDLSDFLGQKASGKGLLIYELEAGRGPLTINRVVCRLKRDTDGNDFNGSFLLHAFRFVRSGHPLVAVRLLEPLMTPVEILASDVAWVADEAEVQFDLPAGVTTHLGVLDNATPRKDLHHIAFLLTKARGTTGVPAWMHDTAQTDGEETTAGKGTISFWQLDGFDFPFGADSSTRPSKGGFFGVSKRTSLPRIQIFANVNDNASATLTFDAASGAGQFDLGAAPADDVEFAGLGETPLGTGLTFEVWDGAAWKEYLDGDKAATDNTPQGGKDLTSVPKQQTYDTRATFAGSSDSLRTPVLRALGVREIKVTDLTNSVPADVDSFAQVSDLLESRMEIQELRLPIVKIGPRQDAEDPISRAIAERTNITSAHVRVSIAADNVDRKDELHIDTFRIDDYEPRGDHVELVCVSALDRLKLTIPKPVSGAVEPAVYDWPTTIHDAFTDLRDGKLGLAARYRGHLPQSGPTNVSDGLVYEKLMGVVGGARTETGVPKATIAAEDKLEVAKEPLEQLARLAGGVLVSSQGKIHYRDLFGAKPVRAFFPDHEIAWVSTSPGLRIRSPRFRVNYQPASTGGTDWTKSVQREDGEIVTDIEQAGTEGGAKVETYGKGGRWIRQDPLSDDTTPDSDGLADAVAHRHVKAFGAGILLWAFGVRIPHPELEFGDMVVVETRQFVARDPILDREIKGQVFARGVIVGKNLWGTEFAIWIRGYADISTTKTTITPKAAFFPNVEIQLHDVVGDPTLVRVRLRANPDSADSVIRYKVLDATATVPERSKDATVWATYSGSFTTSRDAANPKKIAAWVDYVGMWSDTHVAEFPNDPAPEILSITIHIADNGDVTATIQADADTGSIKVAASKTAFPSLATVQAQTAINGRNVTTGVLVTLEPGESVFISAVGYTRTGGTGVEGPLAQAKGKTSSIETRHTNITAAGTGASTALLDLMTHVLPTLADGDIVEFTAVGDVAGVNDIKFALIAVDGVTIAQINFAAADIGDWCFRGHLIKDGTAVHGYVLKTDPIEGATIVFIVKVAALVNLSGGTFKVQGQTTNASDEVTAEYLQIAIIKKGD